MVSPAGLEPALPKEENFKFSVSTGSTMEIYINRYRQEISNFQPIPIGDLLTKHSYSEATLRTAIAEATSIRQALINLGIASKGGNYRVIHRAIAKFGIDVSHFVGQGWAKHRDVAPKRSIEQYLTNSVPTTSFRLKYRLIKEGYFTYKCDRCALKEWQGQAIPLELDHIDGNHKNNSFNNLRLLCPNCHALTPTYRRKKSGRLSGARSRNLLIKSQTL